MKEASTRRPSDLRLYSLLGLMVFFWSLNFVIAKVALREWPPLLLSCFRTTLASLFILPVYIWKAGRKPATWTRGELPALALLGLFGVALNQIFFVAGMSRTSVGHSALMIGLTPVMVLLLAAARGMEKLSLKKLVGMGVALAGIGVLNLSPAKATGATFAGDALVLAAAFTFALFTVGGKSVTKRHDSITVNTFAYFAGALVLAPLGLWLGRDFPWSALSLKAWAALVYMAAFPSVLCYLIFYYALTHISATRVSAVSYIQPLLATFLGAVLLGEAVTSGLATGGLLILLGVYVSERL